MRRAIKTLVNTEELGRAIHRKRVELGLSLRDVANETDVSASTSLELKTAPENLMPTTSRG